MDEKQLQNLQKLARIDLSDDEEKKLLTNLKNILAHVEEMNEVDTKGVEPCSHVIESVYAPLRDDEPKRLIPRDEFLKNAPEHIGGMIRVPKVIKDEL